MRVRSHDLDEGVRAEKNLQSKVLYLLEWNFRVRYFEEEIRDREGHQEESNLISFRLKRSEFPHVSAVRWKKISLRFSCSFSDVHIYIYIHVYICIVSRAILTVAIASREFLNL